MEAQMGKDAFRRRWDDYLKNEVPKLMEEGVRDGKLDKVTYPSIVLDASALQIESLNLPSEEETAVKAINAREVQYASLIKKLGRGEKLTEKDSTRFYDTFRADVSEMRQDLKLSDINLRRDEDTKLNQFLKTDLTKIHEQGTLTGETIMSALKFNRLHLRARLGDEKFREYLELDRIARDSLRKESMKKAPPELN
ncbi:MAG: hypothetical protein V1921_02555 [Candidatus Altiarchaeota archaeon]